MPMSSDIFILTARDLDAREHKAYQRGVERGKFESSKEYSNGPYARNCANWDSKTATCQSCGAQHQDMQVNADFKCPRFTRR